MKLSLRIEPLSCKTAMLLSVAVALAVSDVQAQQQQLGNQNQQQQQGNQFGGQQGDRQGGLQGGIDLDNLTSGQQRNREQQRGRQDNFVGTDVEQLREQFRQRNAQRRRAGLFNFDIENLNEQRNSRRQGGRQGNQAPPVRVKLRPFFAVARPSTAVLSTRVQTNIAKALPAAVNANTQITMNGSVATIKGSVASEYQKKLLAKMIALQPGVSRVENQLVTQQPLSPPFLKVPQ